jgi:C-terminal processing protease CtpA/Prc
MQHVSSVPLQKPDKGIMGFTVSMVDNGVCIQRILPFTPAEGKLCVGDRILKVDQHPTSTTSHAVRMIRGCGRTPTVLTVSRAANTVVLRKAPGEIFGFALHATPQWSLTIKRIQPGSAAARSPLKVGSRVLMINQTTNCIAMSPEEATLQIRTCTEELTLVFC